MPNAENGHITETAREARGGEFGPTVHNVLFISIALVVAAFVVIWVIFFRT